MASIVAALPSTRPPFLVLAPLCVCLGTAVAHYHGLSFNLLHFVLALVGATLSAVAVNTLNEYQDYHSGLDLMTQRTPFSGGSGLLKEQGQLSRAVLRLFQGSLVGVIAIGIYFVSQYGVVMAAVGLLGLAVVISYTQYLNRRPWICFISPGLGFGLLMVIGSYLVQGGELNGAVLIIALIPFFTINNLLLVNQFPDIHADKQVGRNHLAIAYGVNTAVITFVVSAVFAINALLGAVVVKVLPFTALMVFPVLLLSFAAIPKLRDLGANIAEHPPSMAINAVVANVAPLLLAISLVL